MPTERQILLFTDFGPAGPYLGQMESVLRRLAPNAPVIHLLSNAPSGNPQLSAYLLAALRYAFPPHSVFLAVVDPGVGGARKPVVLYADDQYFVGPDNGLFNTVAVQSRHCEWQEIVYHPSRCSASFHGRDIFAPVAARLANGSADDWLQTMQPPFLCAWPADLPAVIYCDYYGNALTGLRFSETYAGRMLLIGDYAVSQADTFCRAAVGEPFWYRNSSGLIEIAVNRGSAQQRFNLQLGDAIAWR
ncbi:MAG: SAM hydrolase/SAM-dependent halogenase family protein [Gammaproteobacteria bacterium]